MNITSEQQNAYTQNRPSHGGQIAYRFGFCYASPTGATSSNYNIKTAKPAVIQLGFRETNSIPKIKRYNLSKPVAGLSSS